MPTYSSGIGEQRSVKLADGSLIYLNAHSRVQVHYTAKARSVDLQDGEALKVEYGPAKYPATLKHWNNGAA